MAHHIICIPGLGDSRSYGQDIAIKVWWRRFGFVPHYFPLGWNKKEGFATKLNRLTHLIDQLSQGGDLVSLVGISAGASAAINAYVESGKVCGVVYICGKINNPGNVSPSRHLANPDFRGSLQQLQTSLQQLKADDRERFLNIHPYFDLTVPYSDTVIPGVAEKRVPGWGHAMGIFSGIFFGAPHIAKFLHGLGGEVKKFG
jgi:hypothetical protein